MVANAVALVGGGFGGGQRPERTVQAVGAPENKRWRQAHSRRNGLGHAGFMPWLMLSSFVYAHRIRGRGELNNDVFWLMAGSITCAPGGAQSPERALLSAAVLQRSGFGGERLPERTAYAASSYC